MRRLLLAALLIPVVAISADWYTDDYVTPTKVDAKPLPPGANASKFIRGSDWNDYVKAPTELLRTQVKSVRADVDAARAEAAQADLEVKDYVSASLASVGAGGGVTPLFWSATGDGVTTRFPIGGATLGLSSTYIVALSGVTQTPYDYSIDTATDEIVFTVAPAAGVPISVRALGHERVVNVPDTSLVTATGSTTARSLAARFADAVNVKDFGAVGDGTTDDTAAIQAAVDSAVVQPDGASSFYSVTIYFPTGQYKITSAIQLPKSGYNRNQRIRVMGAGPYFSKIKQWTAGASIFEFREIAGSPGSMTVFENLGLSGAYTGGAPENAAAILANFAWGIRVEDCWFSGWYQGIHLMPSTSDSRIISGELYVARNVFEFCQNCIRASGNSTVIGTTSRARAADIVTVVTSSAHGLMAGQGVTVRGLGGTGYNHSDLVVESVVDSTTFTYRAVGPNETTAADVAGQVFSKNGQAVHILANEFASDARTDVGGLGSDAVINLDRADTVNIIGNFYAFGVGKGISIKDSRDVVISGENFSMAARNAGDYGAFGKANITLNGSRNIVITGSVFSTGTSGPVIDVTGSNQAVQIVGNNFSNVTGDSAISFTGTGNEGFIIADNVFDNVAVDGIAFSNASLRKSRISGNTFAKYGGQPIKLTGTDVAASSVVIEGNSPDTSLALHEGRISKRFKFSNTANATTDLATINLLAYGAAVVTVRTGGTSQGSGSKGYEARYSIHREAGVTTIAAIGTPLVFGGSADVVTLPLVASGDQSKLQLTNGSITGYLGWVDVEVSGAVAGIDMLY